MSQIIIHSTESPPCDEGLAMQNDYQNGEYDWNFNLDGKTDPLDAYYALHYYAELASNSKSD